MNQPSEQELNLWRQAIANQVDWSLMVKVIVNCPRKGWQGQLADGSWKIGISEPANDNKANEALIKWLASELQCSIKSLKIVSGQTSRRKIIRFIKK
ncbi:MAG TPA: DUF167 domain-containing protein [bacterium]|nr:DUF167 domain-containing protein [bacterium]